MIKTNCSKSYILKVIEILKCRLNFENVFIEINGTWLGSKECHFWVQWYCCNLKTNLNALLTKHIWKYDASSYVTKDFFYNTHVYVPSLKHQLFLQVLPCFHSLQPPMLLYHLFLHILATMKKNIVAEELITIFR